MQLKLPFIFFLGFSLSIFSPVFADSDFIIEDRETIVSDDNQSKLSQRIADNWLKLLGSLIIPGSYNFSKGEYLKGALFLTVEAAAIGGHFYYKREGDKMWDESKNFVDKHFSPSRYFEFRDTLFISESFMMLTDVIRFDTTGHKIKFSSNGEIIKDLDYYEMVGKYLKFTQGWDDVTPKFNDIVDLYSQIYVPEKKGDSLLMYRQVNPDATGDTRYELYLESTYYQHIDQVNRRNSWALVPASNFYFGRSQRALDYMDMRDEANSFYQKSDYMIWILAVNHLSSFIYTVYDIVTLEPDTDNLQQEEQSSFSLLPIINPVVNANSSAKGVLFTWFF